MSTINSEKQTIHQCFIAGFFMAHVIARLNQF